MAQKSDRAKEFYPTRRMDYSLSNSNGNIICIGIPCLNVGGTERQTLSLTRVLRILGFTVWVICYFESSETIVNEFKNVGASLKLLSLDRNTGVINLILKLKKEIQQINPSIVHIQYMTPGALPIIASRLAGVRTIFATVHQPYTEYHPKISKLILRISSILTTKFIAVSQNVEKSWFNSSKVFLDKNPFNLNPHHFTIYNSVDCDKIAEIVQNTKMSSVRKEIGVSASSILIGTVSRLSYEKGIDLLIEAFGMQIKKNKKLVLLIIGTGPELGKLKNQANKTGFSENVKFYGSATWERVITIMSVMDIVITPSRFEGFGITTLEAMAMGKPVIVSNCFGLKELVIEHENGLIFQTNNALDLHHKIDCLISNPEMCKQLGNKGLLRSKSFFDIEIFKKNISSLYFR